MWGPLGTHKINSSDGLGSREEIIVLWPALLSQIFLVKTKIYFFP